MPWIRPVRRSSARATARASSVLPVPGHVLDQDVAVGEQRERDEAEWLVGADDGLRRRPRRRSSQSRRPEATTPRGGSSRIADRDGLGLGVHRGSGLAREPAQDRRQDAALLVVVDLDRAVEPGDRLEPPLLAALVRERRPSAAGAGARPSARPADRVRLAAGQAERRGALAGQELERQDAHPDEVGAVDPLVALGDDRPDAEQRRALGRPVARRARAVLAAGDDERAARPRPGSASRRRR